MKLEKLIIEFKKLGDNLAVAAREDDESELRQLDTEIQNVFSKILDYRPETPEQRAAHCAFLLDHLVPPDRRHGMTEFICQKIIRLAANDK